MIKPQSYTNYWPLIGPLFLPTLFMALMRGISEPILPLYTQSIGGSVAVVGTVVSARAIGSLLATLPSSGVLSRFSMRTTMVAGLLVTTASLLLMAVSGSIWLLFVGWLLVGMGLVLYELARHQFIAALIETHFRGRAVAMLGGLFRLGGTLGPLLGGWLAQRFSLTTPFFAMAACAVVATFIILLTVPAVDQDKHQQETAVSPREHMADLWQTAVLQRRVLLVAGSGQVLMQLVRIARTVLIPLVAANQLGLDVVTVGVVMSIGSALDTLMFLPAGFIMDRLGRKWAIVPSIVMQGVSFLLLPLTTGFATITAVAGLIGFANGFSSGTMMTLGADLAPPDRRVSFLALWRLFSASGFALGPLLVGFVAQAFALGTASLAVGAVGLTAGLVFGRFVPETLAIDDS